MKNNKQEESSSTDPSGKKSSILAAEMIRDTPEHGGSFDIKNPPTPAPEGLHDDRVEEGGTNTPTPPQDNTDKKEGNMSKAVSVCDHLRGGWCKTHGGGARKAWKHIVKEVVGPDGMTKKKYLKRVYYVCDIEMKTKGSLTQPISTFFSSNRQDNTLGGRDSQFSTSTEGQSDNLNKLPTMESVVEKQDYDR